DEAKVMGEPVREPLPPMPIQIRVAKHRLYPDFAAGADLDGTGRYIVCLQIECAAACQFEAGMVPLAGQDAVLNAAAIERETHMGTAIVEREDVPTLMHEQHRAVAAVHNK